LQSLWTDRGRLTSLLKKQEKGTDMKLDETRILSTRGLAAAVGKPVLDPAKLLGTKGLAVMPGGKPLEEF
jgi:hypothetical protein